MAEPPPEVIDELYGAPLDEFTPLRDQHAKELRKQDRAVADAVKKLRKPSVPAWAVNQLSRQAAEDLEALLAAGGALRQAQLGGGDRDTIRSASADERAAVERLVGAAREVLAAAGRGASDAVLEDVRATLHAAASDDEARDLIARGVLTEPLRAVGLGGFGAASAAMGDPGEGAEPKRRETSSERKTSKKRDAEAEAAEREAEAARRRAAEQRAKEAQAALEAAEAAARQAEDAAEAAERERAEAQEALERAEERLDGAQGEAHSAEEAAQHARAELESARAALG